MMVPRKWKDFVVSTGESLRVMGVGGAGFFLKSTTISTVFRASSSRLFWPHQVTRWSMTPVSGVIPTRDEPNEGGVVRELEELDGLVTGGAAVGVQGEEKRGKNAALRGTGADGPGVRD